MIGSYTTCILIVHQGPSGLEAYHIRLTSNRVFYMGVSFQPYNNILLLQLETDQSAFLVTVADDQALLFSLLLEMQVMVWDVKGNAGRDRFFVNPYKDRIEDSTSAIHLGTIQISKKREINLGRKTAYSLNRRLFMGCRLKPSQNGYIRSTFVVPRLFYGLEALLHTERY